jgi:DNA processing protein
VSPLVRVVTLADDDYPDRVRALDAPPARITIEGSLDATRVVAIVGSRNAAPEAAAFAASLAGRVVEAGGVVVSGGAFGIDAAAHRGALAAGGRTWCVAPTGRLQTFPKAHGDLYATILTRGGTMLWPFEDERVSHPGNFFLRNSVLAALADVLVVVQAGVPSGALNAASHARKLGRPVWAVAAAPWDERFIGCLSEIDRGARVLTSIDTFLVAVGLAEAVKARRPSAAAASRALPLPGVSLSPEASRGAPASSPIEAGGFARGAGLPTPRTTLPDDPVQRALLDATSTEARHVDEIAGIARVCAAAAQTALLTLALENVVVEGPEGFYRRVNQRITHREQ